MLFIDNAIYTDTIFLTALTVQFNPVTDRRTEGDQSILSVVLNRPSQVEVTVDFTTRDGSATGKVCIFQHR